MLGLRRRFRLWLPPRHSPQMPSPPSVGSRVTAPPVGLCQGLNLYSKLNFSGDSNNCVQFFCIEIGKNWSKFHWHLHCSGCLSVTFRTFVTIDAILFDRQEKQNRSNGIEVSWHASHYNTLQWTVTKGSWNYIAPATSLHFLRSAQRFIWVTSVISLKNLSQLGVSHSFCTQISALRWISQCYKTHTVVEFVTHGDTIRGKVPTPTWYLP